MIERLRETFPHYDPVEIHRARLETVDLFRTLARETATKLGYAYPTELEETVMTWVRKQEPSPEHGHMPGTSMPATPWSE